MFKMYKYFEHNSLLQQRFDCYAFVRAKNVIHTTQGWDFYEPMFVNFYQKSFIDFYFI